MKVSEHRKFLDARSNILDEVQAFTALYTELIQKRRQLAQLDSDNAEKTRKIEMYSFAASEIADAALKADEDTNLEEEEARLSSYEKLCAGVEGVCTALDGAEDAAIPLLKRPPRIAKHLRGGYFAFCAGCPS